MHFQRPALLVLSLAFLAATDQYQMAPLSAYLIADRQAEITLARTAAPPAISAHATVLVLTPHSYVTAERGSNGFTCLVERAWMSPFDAGAEFWNSKNRSPVCYNPPASRTVLLYTLRRTEMVLSGLTNPQMLERITAAAAANALPTPEPGSMSYMMSKEQYLNDAAHAWHPHLMFHVPKAERANDGASWVRTCRAHRWSLIPVSTLSRRRSSSFRWRTGRTDRPPRCTCKRRLGICPRGALVISC